MSVGLTVNTSDVISDIARYAIAVQSNIEKALLEGATDIQRDAITFAPKDTGDLQNDIHVGLFKEDGNAYAQVWTSKFYAVYVEFGTGQFAKNGDGRNTPWRYQDAKGVWHYTLGNKPQPFMTPAFEKNINAVSNKIAQAVKEAESA